MDWLTLVLVVLATYRLTRLITADRITEPLREWVNGRSEWAGYLVTCDWCLSIWIGPLVVIPAVLWPSTMVTVVVAALSASAVTGLLSLVERRLD